jgi:SAM-dependent methyltransferase
MRKNMNALTCRHCNTILEHTFVDLGKSPFSNSFLPQKNLNEMEMFYPLHAYVCTTCYLVQLPEFKAPDKIFSDYAYFSSYSDTWLKHAKQYVDQMLQQVNFNSTSQVIEIASNDGYLLQYFKEKQVPVLGIEPAINVAAKAQAAGISTKVIFFGANTASELVAEGYSADLLLGNNVLAHVPDINDFVKGMKVLLKPDGIITMEFPHLLKLIRGNQFDTIYHEHFSYLSLLSVERIFASHGLRVYDVESLDTHGGSLRIYACHLENDSNKPSERMYALRRLEAREGLGILETYTSFASRAKKVKWSLLEFLIRIKKEGKTVVGYGAPAKGNTLLNYCGIRTDFIDYTVDRSPHKQGLYLPGTHIPIYHPGKIEETKPDYLLILPWNLKEEIMEQMSFVRGWGGRFVVPIPEMKVYL